MIILSETRYGPHARNRLSETGDPSATGARAALESFYFALNRRDGAVMRTVWADHPLAQLNNPLGGMLRGGGAAADLYDRIFNGPVGLEVSFDEIIEYLAADHAVFAGRETGHYVVRRGEPVALKIRTTRYFRHENGRWAQYHHHGSIDDPESLAGYQRAIADAV